MPIIFWIIISTCLVSLMALVGIFVLLIKEKLLNKILLILVSFASGALLGGAFFHLIPEAIDKRGEDKSSLLVIFICLIFGFCVFFILEQFIRWHHHHVVSCPEIKPFSYLILVSDSIHNFIDGLVIAGSFIISFPIGLATTLAVILHEIPQEIGDFGVLVYGGVKKIKALFLNLLSALVAILGGLVGFWLHQKIGESIIFLLPFAAGNFIYIACSDLIPEIKHKLDKGKSILHFAVFLIGIALMLLTKVLYSE